MRVFSVPASAPFLRTVVAALVDGRLVDGFEARTHPERLAQATLYLPTRRSGRMVREIFLDELGTEAVLLPRIVALGDIDEDELAFAEEPEPYGGAALLDIPPKLGELERRLTLARLVALWAKSPVSAPLVVGGPASTLIKWMMLCSPSAIRMAKRRRSSITANFWRAIWIDCPPKPPTAGKSLTSAP